MDESLRHINPNPVLKANIISRFLFWWCNPLLKKGYKRPLEESDLYNVCPSDSSEFLGNKLEREWIQQLKCQKSGKEPNLLRALYNTFGIEYLLIGFVILLEESTKVIQPILLGGLIRYFTPNSIVSKFEAWMYALGFSLCAIILAISHHPYFFCAQRIGMRMRVACCSLMYRKCLKLSNKAMGETTTGQIVNLMSNDVNRFDQAVLYLHYLWVGPLQAIVVLVILWRELGPSVLAGFFVLLLLIPVQGFMGKLFSKLRHKTAIHTDERVKVMNEIISGIRVIKMYCWEKSFGNLVEKIRGQEIRYISTTHLSKTGMLTVWSLGPWLFLGPIVLLLVLLSQPIRVDSFFMCYMYFNAIHRVVTHRTVSAVQNSSDVSVCCQRMQKFLLLEELEYSSAVKQPIDEPCCLEMNSVTAKWETNTSDNNTLEDITVKVELGQLIAIIGPVGAGKSSLLMAILGELPAQKGEIKVSGKLAYVSQQPWIFSGSVRQNIVLGSAFNKILYDRVIRDSALKRDFEIMPEGDATQIGDRGVSLSGGQRARLSLARALYMDADIYLLDDPLSAVDSAVGRHIFEKCIVEHLKNKPRILVTHQVQFLPVADTIYILKDGRLNGHGTFDELSHSGVDFSELLKRPEDEKPSSISPHISLHADEHIPTALQIDGLVINAETPELGSCVSLHSMIDDYQPEPVQLPETEERASGTVGYSIYVTFFKAGAGVFKMILLVLVNIAAQFFYVGSDWWLSRWANQEEDKYAAVEKQKLFFADHNITDFNNSSIVSNITIPWVDSNFNIYVFTGIIFALFVFGLARALLFFRIAVSASQELHNRMFQRILRTPISFFDTNPVGRILNRFSKDIGHMDDLLPVTFFDFIQCFLLILGIMLVAEIVNPYVIIPTVPLVILFILVRKYYLKTSRSIKRLESTSRSPVFSYLSATLQGVHTIRSMRMEEKFVEEFDAYQDKHSEAWFLFLATSRWLAVRLDWLCAMFVTAVTVCSVLAADTMNAGLVGLSITYTMTLMGMFQWAVRQSAEVENQMISVERVLEYSQLTQEAELESDPDKKPPPTWPQNGAISGKDVCLHYSTNGQLVLRNLTFTINGREKIGIVGRTGAGKSSLINTLFRMVEPQGKLLIDEINIQEIGLHDLRSKISIIPQDPVLFTGSLRQNLDPFQQHTDDQLWKSLDEVKLKDQIKDIPEGLSAEVSEGGVNYSVGQRQLICLARAILGNNRILLIDEATANVDPVTDELIQQTIRTKFKDCTVLTIAHRLHTIMDSDRIMVLDNGQIVEFDRAYTLLSRGQGFFYDMVQQIGKTEFDNLLEIARRALEKIDKLPVVTNGVIHSSIQNVGSTNKTVRDTSSISSDSDTTGLHYGLEDIEEVTRRLVDGETHDIDEDVTENEEVRSLKKLSSSYADTSTSVPNNQQNGSSPDLEKERSSSVDGDVVDGTTSDQDTLLNNVETQSQSYEEPNVVHTVTDNQNVDDDDDDSDEDESQVLLKVDESRDVVVSLTKIHSGDDTVDV